MRTAIDAARVLVALLVVITATWADAQGYRGGGPPPRYGGGDRRPDSRSGGGPSGFLQRMDSNRNGYLERSEISDRARPFIERAARGANLDISRPIPIRRLEESFRRYSGRPDDRSRRPEGGSSTGSGGGPRYVAESAATAPGTIPGFGQVEDAPPILGFGVDAEFMVGVEQADLERAADRIQRYDTNHDGYIDRSEAGRGRWSDDPFQYDKNGDNRLSKQEMALRYATRRMNEAGDSSRSSPSRSRSGSSSQGSSRDDQRRGGEDTRRRGPTPEERAAWSLAESMMDRYDVNSNRRLDRAEWQDLGIKSATADTNRDDQLDRAELAQWLLRQWDKLSQNAPEGLPGWFTRCDLDGDGQVAMAEFADEWTDEKAEEFARYDRNDDGVIVPDECVAANLPEGTYVNHQLQIIPAGTTIYSQIVVPDDDDRPISNLDVQVSITHTRDEQLDAFLTAPTGERVELFTGVGGNDDHFSNTILDDEARWPIVRGRPPFAGRYIPEAAVKREPSLSQFYGENITGTWTLVIRADRSDRPGALHGWSLITEPAAEGSAPDAWDERPGGDRYGRPSESDDRRGEFFERMREFMERRGEGGGDPRYRGFGPPRLGDGYRDRGYGPRGLGDGTRGFGGGPRDRGYGSGGPGGRPPFGPRPD